MFVHIGNYKVISDRKLIGIFNAETLIFSEANAWITRQMNNGDKTIVIDETNKIITSYVSPFTIIKRTSIDKEEFVWRKKYE